MNQEKAYIESMQKKQESEIRDDLKKSERNMKISNDLLSKGKIELEELAESEQVGRVNLLSGNAKIATSLKQKAELQIEKDQLSDKLLKLSK